MIISFGLGFVKLLELYLWGSTLFIFLRLGVFWESFGGRGK